MFRLENVVPSPLVGNTAGSQIWGQTLEIQTEKSYFVSAPSGTGKTTLQHLLYGLRTDYNGTVKIQSLKGEKVLSRLSLAEWTLIRREHLSVVFQDLRLFPQLTALENILLKNQLCRHKNMADIETMATRLGIVELFHKKCGILSYGQRQRVAIIRALIQPFQFLLMDEPFAHLDQENTKKACALVEATCEAEGAGFLLASLGDSYYLDYQQKFRL